MLPSRGHRANKGWSGIESAAAAVMQHSVASAAVLSSPMLDRVHAEARVFWLPRTYWPLAEPSDARTSSLVNIVILVLGRAVSRMGAAPFGFARGAYSTQKQNRFAICQERILISYRRRAQKLSWRASAVPANATSGAKMSIVAQMIACVIPSFVTVMPRLMARAWISAIGLVHRIGP